MNLFGYIMYYLSMTLWVLIPAAVIGLLFPGTLVVLKKKYAAMCRIALWLAVANQIFVPFVYFGLGLDYVDPFIGSKTMVNVVNVARVLVLLLYPMIFFASLAMQGRRYTDPSYGIAAFVSLILSPCIPYVVVRLIDNLL